MSTCDWRRDASLMQKLLAVNRSTQTDWMAAVKKK